MDSLDTEALVRACQRELPHTTAAFERLVHFYKQRVYAVAYRLMGNQEEAEDQAQEVFVKIYRNIKTLDQPATLTGWIYRITTNTCFDALEKQKRRPSTTPLVPTNEDGDEIPQYADEQTPTPEQALMRRELQQCLQRALGQLDTHTRAVVVLRDIEDRSYQEIASIMSLGLSAVKMRIHRARLTMQDVIEKLCPGIGQMTRQGGQS